MRVGRAVKNGKAGTGGTGESASRKGRNKGNLRSSYSVPIV